MTSVLCQHVVNDTYLDVEKLIFHTIHRFVEQHGGSFEEFFEHTGPMFMVAWDRYDKSRGSSFPTFVKWVVWKGLLDLRRNQARHRGKVVFCDLDPELFTVPQHQFNFVDFIDELSTDAKRVVKLVFAMPPGMKEATLDRGGTDKTTKTILRQHLQALGWTAERIAETFQEIRRALQ